MNSYFMKARYALVCMVIVAAGAGCFGFASAEVALAAPGGASEAAFDAFAVAPMGEMRAGEARSAATAASAKPAKPSKAQLKRFKKASADFSVELFQRCVASKGANSNVTVSPMSVMNALAVTANGAGGATSKQMRAVLGDGASMKAINQNLAWYNSKLANVKKARLRSANSIWYHNDGTLKMKKAFLSAGKRYYKAAIKPADFGDPETVRAINSWVAKNTNKMIKRVINQLSAEDRIAMVNALYFDAEWAKPYEKDQVHKHEFTSSNGEKRKVDMMFGTERTYLQDKNATGFMKPYAKGYSYVALLPKEGMSLKEYVSTLSGDSFRKIIARATHTTVHTALPKYSVTYSNDDMGEQLKAMGMTEAFSEGADFSKMATDSLGNLSIGSVVHKTRVDLNEQGTKAAAVTAVVAKANSAFDPNAKTVTLDRPFVYAIVDNATKLPLFIGTVSDIAGPVE